MRPDANPPMVRPAQNTPKLEAPVCMEAPSIDIKHPI
jgi:hypothetical protein